MGPWSLPGDTRIASHNQLVDVLSRVPGFLHEQEEFNTTNDESIRHMLLHEIRHQLAITRAWRSQWEQSNPGAACQMGHEPAQPLLGLIQSYPLPEIINCSSWKQATEITLYNGMVLSLLGILWSLEPPPMVGELVDELSCLEQLAMEISRTFETQLTTDGQRYGVRLREVPLLTREEICSARESTQVNSILRGLWLRLWPSFPFI